jgi:methylated-DNA-[protein]-cysteine S-methyltransferase
MDLKIAEHTPQVKAGVGPSKRIAPEMDLPYHIVMVNGYAYSRYASPFGDLYIAADARGITELGIGVKEGDFLAGLVSQGIEPAFDNGRFSDLFRLLDEYFKGRPVFFSVPLNPTGTAFDRVVWKALSAIPWGGKLSYGEVASVIGKPGAARAVGGACGRNPIPIIVPCHRVLQSGGFVGGYSGGEGVKEKLLALECIPFKARRG